MKLRHWFPDGGDDFLHSNTSKFRHGGATRTGCKARRPAASGSVAHSANLIDEKLQK